MKYSNLCNCEKNFISKCVRKKQRLDGRDSLDYRRIKVVFGSDFGCCQVLLGGTRVFAQVSSEIGTPRPSKPKDGILYINIEFSPMAGSSFDSKRVSDESVAINRLLDRCIKDSLCINTESLCIIAGEKVWIIRVNVTVLNYEGNILDAACLAAVSALSHFRLREVKLDDKEITLFSYGEKNPAPLSIIHRPYCVTFAFFHNSTYMLVDPSELEESVCDGQLIICMNKHREICIIQSLGKTSCVREQILRCTSVASTKVARMTEIVQEALEKDHISRSSGETPSFGGQLTSLSNFEEPRLEFQPSHNPEPVSVVNSTPSEGRVLIEIEDNDVEMEAELEDEQRYMASKHGASKDTAFEVDISRSETANMRAREKKKRSQITKQKKMKDK